MHKVTENIYIEDDYPGATLGVISLPHGLIEIDAPPSLEDGRSWRASLLNLGGGNDRVLINLDAHPDRALGSRAMDCTVITQEKAAQIFRSRPTTFKAQGEESGADWESIPGLGNIRWILPEITFSQQMTLYWGDEPVILEHHPGPSSGATWVILPEQKVVFVGDLVVRNAPPFLAGADLPEWLDTLKLLLTSYRNWIVISGRGGVVTADIIRAQKDYIDQVRNKVEKLAQKKAPPDAVENLIPSLLNPFKAPASRQQKYAQRLRHGLFHYYTHHYHSVGNPSAED